MKKKILISFGIILCICTILKLREVIIFNKINVAIEQFRNEKNRYYLFLTQNNSNIQNYNEIFLKNNLIKIVQNNSTIGNYCEWKDLETGEVNIHKSSNKEKFENESAINEDTLFGLPNFITNIHKNNGIKITQLLKVYYIIPTTYNNKPCYKISTTSEDIIIDKETYLPLYSLVKTVNSNRENEITENTYKFEVNTVTDEDVTLPSFEEYEQINKN